MDAPSPAGVIGVQIKSGANASAAVLSTAIKERKLWITPDNTQTLMGHLPTRTRTWIQSGYSLTSIKHLLRTAVEDSTGQEGGIRYSNWLLPSLCFWAAVDSAHFRDAEVMAEHLLKVQS